MIVYILLFSSVITLIGTGLQLYLEFDRDIKSIHTSLNQVESSYLQSIINSLWVSDDELLRIQLEGILRLPDMQLVEVRKETEVLCTVGVDQTENIIEQTIPLIYIYDGREVLLGELQVVASLNGVYARILDRVLVILCIQTVKTFLVALFIFFLFYQLVGRHIIDMASYVESMRFESMDQPLHLNRKPHRKKPDEVDQLAASFNRMRENLARYITECKQADVALRESEERFRTICENAPALINAFDEDRQCTFWNQQCRKTFGWTIDEINAHDNAMVLFYPDPAICDEVIRSVTSDPDGDFKEWHPLTKAGKTLTTIWANFRVPGGLVFNLGYDITDRKRVEEELADHRAGLEEKVRERTQEQRLLVNAMAGRENRMAELKGTIKKLRTQLEEAGMAPVVDDSMEGDEGHEKSN
jgi:PAS domain S-box-containing protein